MSMRRRSLLAVALVLAWSGAVPASVAQLAACDPTAGPWRLSGPVPAGVVWGIDVSAFQDPANIDYSKLRASGMCSVHVRAGKGAHADKSAPKHVAQAKAAGIPRIGTYWAIDGSPIAAQAAAYRAALTELRPNLPPVVDVESTELPAPIAGPTAALFAALVDSPQRRTWCYTYPDYYRRADLARWCADRPLWLAEYTTRKADPAARSPRNWPTGVTLWQYGGGPLQTSPAVGPVDKNVWISEH